MSLAEKFNEYCEQQKKMFTDGDPIEQIIKKIIERAFYAGAEAALKESEGEGLEGFSAQAEIDQFRRKA